ncbi:MAG TPA: c-type cytochrome [Aggregatilineaceae bacterium]|nr:c-type cytochrome [Aggregatilineaceae bacterium]
MRKILKWLGIILGVLVLLVLVLSTILYFVGKGKLDKTYEVKAQTLTIPTDETARERGQHLVEAVSICTECHGNNLGGDVLLDNAVLGKFIAPNLTAGKGGIGGTFDAEDYVRAIRYGVDEDGKPLLGMPSNSFATYSDADLGSIIAYLQAVPAVDHEAGESEFGLPLYVMIGTGLMGDLPADKVEDGQWENAPEPGVTAEYGNYLISAASCRDCHGDDLTGGTGMAGPKGPDLTEVGQWSEADFMRTLRTGLTPDDKRLDSEEMPWDYYTYMTDEELQAIWTYLQTLD